VTPAREGVLLSDGMGSLATVFRSVGEDQVFEKALPKPGLYCGMFASEVSAVLFAIRGESEPFYKRATDQE
jgi:hypothetical protein